MGGGRFPGTPFPTRPRQTEKKTDPFLSVHVAWGGLVNESNSKHWFTTCIVLPPEEGAGKRGLECGSASVRITRKVPESRYSSVKAGVFRVCQGHLRLGNTVSGAA